MALRLGPLKFPWARKDSRKVPSTRLGAGPSTRLRAGDPYWDFFLNTPPADLANSITELIRRAPDGNVFPTKAELHTPEITSSHVKELARYLGADLVGIVNLDSNKEDGYPFAVVCAIEAEYDPREAPGIGGQVPVQNGLFVSFVLSAWIRELGFRATASVDPNAERLAVAAGLGTLGPDGSVVTAKYGARVHVANVIRTDLPLAPD
ncbi:MAG: hypothetical protein ACREQP_03330 [Candidatus Binatia bacterium]